MLIRTFHDVLGSAHDVDWTNGTSRRLLVAADGRGYTLTDTYVRPGTTTLLRYDRHLEACYCVEGEGRVETADGLFALAPGTLYAPDPGEEHRLTSAGGMRLICVFSPALKGDENHDLAPGRPSGF
ncbi:cupin domain-containing protein [Nonomuraea longispora]|uniref:L-ectoine synthase n=1 Tax=Nonomuraea longispora TaxID=1848320 RepID=A0A4R4MUR3_9ACTN|nr:ectoine synthase [Nonomuraea longispora]TDB99898.1 cupin domain-containing protein [Nonomuraea longispora]